jgi:hypothetical protein
MGLVFGFLVGILTLLVLAFCVLGAIWESMRVNKDLKRLEQQWRRRPPNVIFACATRTDFAARLLDVQRLAPAVPNRLELMDQGQV